MREEKGESTGRKSTYINTSKHDVAASVMNLKLLGREGNSRF